MFLLAFQLAIAAQQPDSTRPPAWTKGATCYEVFVRSFQDSDGDGIGDLNGLTARLDYINAGDPRSRRDLGARCIWLMPIAESPSYHGYDATDYYMVERDYGTNADFKRLVSEAHKRGIRILVDLVLNHTSSDHPYFQAALRDTASPYRAWYRFASPKPDQKGPWGQDVWTKSPVRDEFYYAVFWRGMPDLNYETPAVREEAKRIARFWLEEMNVDGFRLDAVPFLMEDHGILAGSPGTHELLREWSAYVRALRPDAFTVAEVYDSIGAQLPYWPDQIDSYFAFEVADSIVSAARQGSAKGLLAPVLRLQRNVPRARWSPFLRNHDQPRTRTELGGSITKSRIASFVMLTMPGIPFVYYGEEIGMTGAKPDERLRTPMQWSRAHEAGFTTGKPWEALQPDSFAVTVAREETDPRSLLNRERRLIHLRAENPALGNGTLIPLAASSDAVAAYLRRDGTRTVLVIANLGDASARGVALSSADSVLAPGRHTVRSLLPGTAAASLRIGTDGRITNYMPVTVLAGAKGYLFEIR